MGSLKQKQKHKNTKVEQARNHRLTGPEIGTGIGDSGTGPKPPLAGST